MAATTSSTSSCSGFFNLRSNNVEPRMVRPSSSSSTHGSPAGGCGKVDGVAMWFINGVTAAFFASLERCSCIRIATEDDGEEANDLPLIHSDGNVRHEAGTTSRRRTAGKGKKGGGRSSAFLQD
ncbi:hypothetical protein DITRI_Ditri03aG0181100 [Diplodiscus trichospermus]